MKTILCIDSGAGAGALARIVERAGFRVIITDNSGAALRIFLSQSVDGVLLHQHCCSEVESRHMQQQMRRAAPDVPVLLFDGPAEVAQSALPWMNAYIEDSHKPARTNA